MIACKPRLADFMQHYELAGFNKISQKHVDFLICRMEDGMPMLGIELDDASHEAPDRRKRDADVNTMFALIGIPLLRIHVSEMEQVEQFVAQLDRAWHRRTQTLLQGAVKNLPSLPPMRVCPHEIEKHFPLSNHRAIA